MKMYISHFDSPSGFNRLAASCRHKSELGQSIAYTTIPRVMGCLEKTPRRKLILYLLQRIFTRGTELHCDCKEEVYEFGTKL